MGIATSIAVLVELHPGEFDADERIAFNVQCYRLGVPDEVHSFKPGVFVFEVEGGNMLLFAAIEDVDFFGAESFGCVGGVDGGVACSDDDYCSAPSVGRRSCSWR